MKKVTICSDGSACSPKVKNGPKVPGGCAAVIRWEDDILPVRIACSGEMEATIGRMELKGVICGLRALFWQMQNLDMIVDDETSDLRNLTPEDLEVSLIVDSLFVCKSATGINKRSSHSDLWMEFDGFGSKFGKIEIQHRPRNTLMDMEEADRAAGDFRKALDNKSGPCFVAVESDSYILTDFGKLFGEL